MNAKELEKARQAAREVVEATTSSLCQSALHMTAHYKCEDLFACIDRMTDEEWTAWSDQPAFVRPIYVKLSQSGDGWRDLVQLAFSAKAVQQARTLNQLAA